MDNIGTWELPGIILVKDGSLIPHISLAQSTVFMDWSTVEMVPFSAENKRTSGFILELNKQLVEIKGEFKNGEWKLSRSIS